MQRNNAKKKKRLISASIAGALTVAIVGTALYNDSSVALARPSLPGVETIVNENSAQKPFYILEIVDDYSSARIGYTIAGEEPGYYDDYRSQAISDMASWSERYDRYMKGNTHDPSQITAPSSYSELSGYAFNYTAYDEGSSYANRYQAGDEGVIVGQSYGSFVENTNAAETPAKYGFYEEADQTSDFLKVNIGDPESEFNLTIDDVYRKQPGSDQTGVFYMNYINFGPKTGTDATKFYNVDTYTKISDMSKHPFKDHGYTTTYDVDVTDPDTNTTTTLTGLTCEYYDPKYYTYNEPLVAEDDVETVVNPGTDPDDTSDDTTTDTHNYLMSATSSLSDGDVIYVKESGILSYFGYITTAGTDLVFVKAQDNTQHPLQGTETYVNGTLSGAADDSFPKMMISEGYTGGTTRQLCTVRTADKSEEVDLFYISSAKHHPVDTSDTLDATHNHFEVYTKFNSVNDPTQDPADFGIKDESAETPAWYHVWYYKKGAVEPYSYVAAGNKGFDFAPDYTGDIVNTYYHKGGYTNNELFKKYVLDVDADKCSSICIDVITKKASEVTIDDISKANLVYFTGGNYTTDMDEHVAAYLVRSVYEENKPVVINMTCLTTSIGPNFSTTTCPYLKWMYLLLLQQDLSNLKSYLNDDNTFNFSPQAVQNFNNFGGVYYNSTIDVSHVTGSVFVNDDRACHDAIYSDSDKAYSDAKLNGFTLPTTTSTFGFDDVKRDIEEELFYLNVAGKNTDSFNSSISKFTCIRHILNYGGRRTVGKTGIRVLDLEPYYCRDIEGDPEQYRQIDAIRDVYYNTDVNNYYRITNIADIRDIFEKKWFKTNVSDTTENIAVTGMSTKEFIGRIEDINEMYDLIYIGMDTAYMNVTYENTYTRDRVTYASRTKNVVTNDGTHYVYRHTGDEITTNGQTGINGTWCMGGNDITPDKLRELQNYVKAGYAVILSDEFFDKDSSGKIAKNSDGTLSIDTDRIEEESYLYDFIDWCTTEKDGNDYAYLYKNVEITTNFEANSSTSDSASYAKHRESFVRYLNISKLEVELIEQPPLYNPYDTNDSDVHYYLQMNNIGKYSLDYKVRLTNDAAVDTTNTSYDCKLYIDHDADGRFEGVEALDSLDIVNVDNGDVMYVQDDGKYHLSTGATYTISRFVPEGYVGLIPWKLVFIENRSGAEDAQIKSAVQDYAAIRDLTNKPVIRVLQLTGQGNGSKEGNGATNLNLNLVTDARLQQLYEQVNDFDLEIDIETVEKFVNKTGTIFGGTETRLEKLYDYDMLVMGFTDVYEFKGTDPNNLAKTKEAVLAVREYMLTGRSVLFTHDLTSTRAYDYDSTDWGVMADRYLRDIQGMDRYGYVVDNVKNLKFADGTALSEYVSAYDTRFSSVNDRDPIGFSDSNLLRKNSNTWGEISARYTRNTEAGNGERELTNVARVNRGQITEYPFRIGKLEKAADNKYYASEYITVAKTHHQYFQLDLETNYTDGNYDDDIVVWYTISMPGTSGKNYHRLNYNDVRNNYYIYNKGNITYTGAGHNKINGDEEKKLFVNTLVAAYNAGTHAPYASYKNDATLVAKDITSEYLPYDISMSLSADEGGDSNGWLQDTVTVYFKTINNNLQDNLKPVVAQYYVEVPSGGDITVDTKQYKIITPVSIKECTADRNGNVTESDVSDYQVLTNGRTYKLEFRISDLMNGDLQGVNSRYHAVIYTRLRTQSANKTLEQDKAELASTGQFLSLPANDSMKPLNINFTQLYDLR